MFQLSSNCIFFDLLRHEWLNRANHHPKSAVRPKTPSSEFGCQFPPFHCCCIQVESLSLELVSVRSLDVQLFSFLGQKLSVLRNHAAVRNRPVTVRVRTRYVSFKIMVQNCSKALQLQQDQSRKAKTSKAQTTMETLPRCSPVATLQDGGSKEPQAALKPKRSSSDSEDKVRVF